MTGNIRKRPSRRDFHYDSGDSRYTPPVSLNLEDFSITVDGVQHPLNLKVKIDGHTKQVWMFADNAPYKPYELTLHKEYKGFLRTIEIIRKIYGGKS
ncbi:MAG: hypothetical protein QXW75_00530 [Thermoplasmatales archaeon]